MNVDAHVDHTGGAVLVKQLMGQTLGNGASVFSKDSFAMFTSAHRQSLTDKWGDLVNRTRQLTASVQDESTLRTHRNSKAQLQSELNNPRLRCGHEGAGSRVDVHHWTLIVHMVKTVHRLGTEL